MSIFNKMTKLSVVNWFRNISITRKLYFTVGIMALLIAVELVTLQFAIRTLSSVRALVGAEGLWSKAQKDAAYSLQKYGRTKDEVDYRKYLSCLSVPMGDRRARLELFKPNPNLAIVRQGFLQGRFHPDDVDGSISLLRRFHSNAYLNRAIQAWSRGDTLIGELMDIGSLLHTEINNGASPEKVNLILAAIDPLNDELTKLEDEFSFALGEGSRWLAAIVLTMLLALVLTVEITSLSITILVSRGISVGLYAIISSSKRLAKGDYNARARVFSKDEIGVLAMAFNDMAARLLDNMEAMKQHEADLKQSKEQAELAAAVKANFMTSMSHEIRTPMNAVIGFTHLLESTALDERQKDFVRSVKVSGNNLLAIINDILDYSKLESGKVVMKRIPFSLTETFHTLDVILQPKAREKKLNLKLHIDKYIPETVIGDPTRLTQVLLNLSDNAIKFTDKGHVEISVRLQSQNNTEITLQFSIADTGKGVPEDKKYLIFERFIQASPEAKRRYGGGTGLGLSIAKNLVELQKGTMSVTSEPNKGSVFSFVITYGKATDLQGNAIETALLSNKKQLSILVAEDEHVNQSIVLQVLKKFGFEGEIAENGRIAVEKIQQKNYDLILMDMNMPEMDGYEATVLIRNKLKNNVPIIALTSLPVAEEKEKCLSIGMNDFVSKPFNSKELHEKIMQFF